LRSGDDKRRNPGTDSSRAFAWKSAPTSDTTRSRTSRIPAFLAANSARPSGAANDVCSAPTALVLKQTWIDLPRQALEFRSNPDAGVHDSRCCELHVL